MTSSSSTVNVMLSILPIQMDRRLTDWERELTEGQRRRSMQRSTIAFVSAKCRLAALTAAPAVASMEALETAARVEVPATVVQAVERTTGAQPFSRQMSF